MSTVRRVYLYTIAAVSLLILAAGVVSLGQAFVLAATSGADRLIMASLRGQVAQGAAASVVGLPVWLLHWVIANRAAHRDAAERAALLRRLYTYAALAIAAGFAWFGASAALDAGLRFAVAGASSATQIALPIPVVLVAAVLWWYHRRVATLDRAATGETGGDATLRRWYRYGIAFAGLAVLLNGAALVVRLFWEVAVTGAAGSPASGGAAAIAAVAATALVALAIWLSHWLGWAVAPPFQRADIARQDAASTLRPVYLFLALTLSVVTTLVAAWQMLFYSLGRLLDVPSPGGAGGSLLLVAAGPISLLLVYGVSWIYHREALAFQAKVQAELPGQAGVRRLYVYLICFAALAILTVGVGGLLWTVADLATNAPHAEPATWWRERVSLYVAMAAIGLPVWLLHWQPVARASRQPGEADSLARRLYVYLTLLAGVLTLLGAGVVAMKQVFDLALGEATTPSVVTNLARALSVVAVAGIAVYYHQRVLRADVLTSRRTREPSAPPMPEAASAAGPAPETTLPVPAGVSTVRQDGAPSTGLRPFGLILHLRDGAETTAWYATAGEARAAYERLRAQAVAPDWVVLVKLEEELGAPGAEPHGPAALAPAA
jgi:hypothetical protein